MHTKGCTEIYKAFELLAAKDIDSMIIKAIQVLPALNVPEMILRVKF